MQREKKLSSNCFYKYLFYMPLFYISIPTDLFIVLGNRAGRRSNYKYCTLTYVLKKNLKLESVLKDFA